MDKNRNSLFASILKTVSALLGIMSLKTDLFTSFELWSSVENVRPSVSTRVRLRLQTVLKFCLYHCSQQRDIYGVTRSLFSFPYRPKRMCERSKLQIIVLSSNNICLKNQLFGGTKNQSRTHHVSVKKIARNRRRVCRYSDTTFPFSCRLPFTIFTQK